MGWGSRQVLALLTGAVVLLVVWIRVEATSRVPLIACREHASTAAAGLL
jgi:hypothetical protein